MFRLNFTFLEIGMSLSGARFSQTDFEQIAFPTVFSFYRCIYTYTLQSSLLRLHILVRRSATIFPLLLSPTCVNKNCEQAYFKEKLQGKKIHQHLFRVTFSNISFRSFQNIVECLNRIFVKYCQIFFK